MTSRCFKKDCRLLCARYLATAKASDDLKRAFVDNLSMSVAILASATFFTVSSLRAADTEIDVNAAATDLTSAARYTPSNNPSAASDITFTAGTTYVNPTGFTINSTVTFGSLNGLNASALAISNTCGAAVSHAPGSIPFKSGGGAINQMRADAFRIWMKRGGLLQQGPQIIAYQPGDTEYRRADRPVHPWLGSVNKAGAPQTITFPQIADQHPGPGPIELQATSSVGLPVQFYVVSGPVQIDPLDNSKLSILKIPARAKFPVRVVIGTYQFGRMTDPKMQNAEPVFQEFMLQK